MNRITVIAILSLILSTGWATAGRSEPANEVKPQGLSINIPGQPVGDALNEFAAQSGLQVVLYTDVGKGIETKPVVGHFNSEGEALKAILTNTGLSHEYINDQTIVVQLTAESEDKDMGKSRPASNKLLVAQAGTSAQQTKTSSNEGDDESGANKGGVLEEVIITAQRREDSLQDVTISVRSLGESELKRMGADSLQDYAGFVPSLELIQLGGGLSQINVRGVSTGEIRADRPEIGETVGLYLDETPISSQFISPDMALLDLERIEVLRGPQATLYGAGSLAGTVRMVSRKANLSEFQAHGSVAGSYTEFGGGNAIVDGVVNLPLIEDKLAFRGVGFYRDLSGYMDNNFNGINNENDNKVTGGRVGLRYTPTDKFEVNAHVLYQENDFGSRSQYVIEAGELNRVTNTPEPADSELLVASLVAEYDFHLASLTSVTSYYSQEHFSHIDFGGITEFITGVDDSLTGDLLSLFDTSEFSQELRLVSNTENNFSWIAGIFYQKKNNGYGQDLPIPGLDAVLGISSTVFSVEPDNSFKSIIDNDTEQVAVYGEATYRFLERWSFTAGVRWFDVNQDSTIFFGGVFADPNIGTATGSNNESGVNPKFNLSFDIDDERMVYVQVARGFRLGGVNQPVPQSCAQDALAIGLSQLPESFDSDHLWNYELGLKSSWFDNRLRFNGAGYYIDWKTPPVSTDFACGFSTVVNAGSYDIIGGEFDVEAALSDRITLRAGLSYTNSELGEDVPNVNGLKGDRAPYTPEFTANLSLDYDFPLVIGGISMMGFSHINLRWTDERITNFPLSVGSQGVYSLPTYGMGNARFGISTISWQVELFIDNLWDERPQVARSAHPFLDVFPSDGLIATVRPRTFGMKVSYSY